MGKKTSFQNIDATQYLKGWEIMGRKIHSKEKTTQRKEIARIFFSSVRGIKANR